MSALETAFLPIEAAFFPIEFPLTFLGPASSHIDFAARNQTDQPAAEHGMVRIRPFGVAGALAFGDEEGGGGIVLGL